VHYDYSYYNAYLLKMKEELSKEVVDAFEGIIQRRIENTNETREQACKHIADYLTRSLTDK
jgi:hypothetical protein